MSWQSIAIERVVDGDVAPLAFGGELTRTAVAAVLDELTAVLEAGATSVHLGLAGVSFMDSFGLAMLVRVEQRLGPTRVTNANRPSSSIDGPSDPTR